MKFLKKHIILFITLFTVVTIMFQTNSVSKHVFIESEIEEVIDEIETSTLSSQEFFFGKHKDGGLNGLVNEAFEPLPYLSNLHYKAFQQKQRKTNSNKVAYFILYCSLKIAC